MREPWILYEEDCLGPCGMARLEAGCADLAVLDPPYSEEVHARFGAEGRNDGTPSRDALRFAAWTGAEIGSAAVALCRIARRWIIVFGDEFTCPMWRVAIECAGGEYVRRGLWVKSNPMPQTSGDRPANGAEEFVICHAPRPNGGRTFWNGGGRPATYFGDGCNPRSGEAAPEHPTQKPVWLIEALIRDFGVPGETVCDPVAGSGTTGVAALRRGHRFVGFERDPKYAAIARKRLGAAREQPGLFGPRGPRPKQMVMP